MAQYLIDIQILNFTDMIDINDINVNEFVDFETAKLLREKGFDYECRQFFNKKGEFKLHTSIYSSKNSIHIPFVDIEPNYFSAPSRETVTKWLREIYNLVIIIKPCRFTSWEYTEFYYEIQKINSEHSCIMCDIYNHESWTNYNDALDAAILYCLNNLIEEKNETETVTE